MITERLRWLRTKFSHWFLRRRNERALDAELRFHLDALTAEFIAQGLSAEEARRAASREFGVAADAFREEVRDAWRPPAWSDLIRSARFAARSLVRTPGFALIGVGTLALGIGANTAMYSVVSSVTLKPLPYPASGQLDQIYRTTAQEPEGPLSAPEFLELRAQVGHYGEAAAFAHGDVSLAQPGQPAEFAPALRVSGNFFRLLGILPQLGRDFGPEEEQRGRHRVAVLSRRCWRDRFAAAPGVIGRMIRINGEPHEVIGVLPESFNEWRHLGWVDVFRPLGFTDEERADRQQRFLEVLGRRAPSVGSDRGGAFIAAFGERLAAEHPADSAGSSWRSVPLEEVRRGQSGGVVAWLLVALSGFVVLIACSNLANLLLARTMARAREFAVRAALGASRAQLLRPLVLEALLLALVGGVAALLVVMAITDWFTYRSTGTNGEQVVFPFHGTVFVWAMAASLLTALAFGLAPALFALRLDLNETLKSGGRAGLGGRGHRRMRHLLIVGQFALAMILLAGAAFVIRGLEDLNTRRQGWDPDPLVTGTFLLPPADYPADEAIRGFQREVLERIEALPGVQSASLSFAAPFLGWPELRKYQVEGREPPAAGREPAAYVNGVTPGYFATVGTSLVAGRAFNEHDGATSPRVYIVNEAMAAALFGGENPLGRRLARLEAGALEWGEIVGVARDVKSIAPDFTPVSFQLYQPLGQEPRPYHELAVRADGVEPATLVKSIRGVITELDGDLPVRNLKPANDRIARANYQIAVLRDILAWFAVLGLGLAAMGVYGVIARLMAQRTGEFGIRLALGAQIADVTRLVLGSGVKLALCGSLLGILGGFGVVQLLATAFPGMNPRQGASFIGATLLLLVVAVLASYLPARRASRINPVDALRAE